MAAFMHPHAAADDDDASQPQWLMSYWVLSRSFGSKQACSALYKLERGFYLRAWIACIMMDGH
jgi:hypothetical protein